MSPAAPAFTPTLVAVYVRAFQTTATSRGLPLSLSPPSRWPRDPSAPRGPRRSRRTWRRVVTSA